MTTPQNQQPRKHALITSEQEALLRAFENAKKMNYGEFTIYMQGGNIVRYEIKKSKSMTAESKKANPEIIQEAATDLGELEEVIAI